MTQSPYTPARWSLADLFPAANSPELESAMKSLEQRVADFERVRDDLTPAISGDRFNQILADLEEINRIGYRLGGFAGLWFAEDTQNQAAQTLRARLDQFTTELANRVLFFSLWWKDLDDANANRLSASAGDRAYWLEELRHFKPHTLSEAEEKIINIKNVTGISAIETLYDSITNRYVYKVTVDGQVRDLTRGELMSLARQHDPDLRARAYQELYRVYGEDAPILGQIYQTVVRDWRNEKMMLRRFANPISARNLANDIPDPVVDTLLDVSRKNVPVFQRFFNLKARWLDMERLRRYDLYAPVAKSDQRYEFNSAANMVLESFGGFDPRLAAMVQRVLDQNHLDSEVRKGKRSGAFCSTIGPDLTPWVLVNYQGRADDVATLAHEMGHAIHSMLAEHHSLFTQHACLPLAETASTFGEMMLIDRLMQEAGDDVRRDLLFKQVDDAYATIQRQAFFAMFERQAHEMVQQNASTDELAEAYFGNLKMQFGESLTVSDEFRWEWVSIPHIYQVPFYVYAYAFGQLLVLSLYQQYKQQGDAFKPRYLQILSAGGSVAPVKLLADAGIDVYQADFWQGGFDAILSLVKQLEDLPMNA